MFSHLCRLECWTWRLWKTSKIWLETSHVWLEWRYHNLWLKSFSEAIISSINIWFMRFLSCWEAYLISHLLVQSRLYDGWKSQYQYPSNLNLGLFGNRPRWIQVTLKQEWRGKNDSGCHALPSCQEATILVHPSHYKQWQLRRPRLWANWFLVGVSGTVL